MERLVSRWAMMGSVMLDLTAYELLWPTELFVAEAERVARSQSATWTSRAEWLLTEAFSGTTAAVDFEDAAKTKADKPSGPTDPWETSATWWTDTRREWFNELVRRAGELRHANAPRPYWPHRSLGVTSRPAGGVGGVRQRFVQVITEFEDNGYLAEAFGMECVDNDFHLADRAEVIERRLGVPGLWPLAPDTWADDVFYGLIEVFHDLVSRPRSRYYHSYSNCGWHYSEFHAAAGRALYAWKINSVLRAAGIEYELATEGEDRGRLVAVTDDGRADLVHHALHNPVPSVRERVHHAVALFRSRSASPESKRSAIVALVGLLEERRQLIREDVGRQDEGALFEIANRFDLRHRRADQHGDYDEAFLDWIFWWYLATVELTNRLLATRSA